MLTLRHTSDVNRQLLCQDHLPIGEIWLPLNEAKELLGGLKAESSAEMAQIESLEISSSDNKSPQTQTGFRSWFIQFTQDYPYYLRGIQDVLEVFPCNKSKPRLYVSLPSDTALQGQLDAIQDLAFRLCYTLVEMGGSVNLRSGAIVPFSFRIDRAEDLERLAIQLLESYHMLVGDDLTLKGWHKDAFDAVVLMTNGRRSPKLLISTMEQLKEENIPVLMVAFETEAAKRLQHTYPWARVVCGRDMEKLRTHIPVLVRQLLQSA